MSSSRLNKKTLSQEDLFNLSELFKLMKPRVMSLVIFTCAVGLLTSPGTISTKDAIIGILLVSIGAGAAGALGSICLPYMSGMSSTARSVSWPLSPTDASAAYTLAVAEPPPALLEASP